LHLPPLTSPVLNTDAHFTSTSTPPPSPKAGRKVQQAVRQAGRQAGRQEPGTSCTHRQAGRQAVSRQAGRHGKQGPRQAQAWDKVP
jgi:hypothetical protein